MIVSVVSLYDLFYEVSVCLLDYPSIYSSVVEPLCMVMFSFVTFGTLKLWVTRAQ